ncbi:MAG: PEP-utilizing enzyme [Panacagrimonas sp.]
MSHITTKWGAPEKTHTVAFFHERIRRLVAERARTLDKSWAKIATEHTLDLLNADDLLGFERELLETGYRFDASATVSHREQPDKYKQRVVAEAGPEAVADAQGRIEVGQGDNLVQGTATITGIARFISTLDQVTDMLVEGVPENTVAVIDDSGGTLTAPILEDFKAVLCLGGTVRSHLGILTREYGIPCFMNCKIGSSLSDGDQVELELTAPAVTGEDYETGRNVRAKIWLIARGGP